jgi:hypothetical protein
MLPSSLMKTQFVNGEHSLFARVSRDTFMILPTPR